MPELKHSSSSDNSSFSDKELSKLTVHRIQGNDRCVRRRNFIIGVDSAHPVLLGETDESEDGLPQLKSSSSSDVESATGDGGPVRRSFSKPSPSMIDARNERRARLLKLSSPLPLTSNTEVVIVGDLSPIVFTVPSPSFGEVGTDSAGSNGQDVSGLFSFFKFNSVFCVCLYKFMFSSVNFGLTV